MIKDNLEEKVQITVPTTIDGRRKWGELSDGDFLAYVEQEYGAGIASSQLYPKDMSMYNALARRNLLKKLNGGKISKREGESNEELLKYVFSTYGPRTTQSQLKERDETRFRTLRNRKLLSRLDRLNQAEKLPFLDNEEFVDYAATKYQEIPLEDIQTFDSKIYSRVIAAKLTMKFINKKKELTRK